MQQINLDLDKENELIFKISIEGTRPASSRSRFLLESPDYTLVFPAESFSNGQVSVVIPTLEKVLEEGLYSGSLEVIVDDRVFVPIKLGTEFKKSLKVVAESVVRKKEETVVSAESVVVVNQHSVTPTPSRQEKQEMPKEIAIKEVPEDTRTLEVPKVENTASRPAQRNRVRPDLLRESRTTKSLSSKNLIEKISKKHGINLTEAQFKSVLRQYAISKKQKGGK